MGTLASVLVRASLYNQLCGTVARFWEPAAKHRERHGRYGLAIGGDTTRNLEPKLLLGHHCTGAPFHHAAKKPKSTHPSWEHFHTRGRQQRRLFCVPPVRPLNQSQLCGKVCYDQYLDSGWDWIVDMPGKSQSARRTPAILHREGETERTGPN